MANEFFNVVEKEVAIAGTDTIIPNKKVLVRDDYGTPLAIVGKGYKVIHNKEIVDAFETALDSLPDFKERTITSHLPFGGAQMFRMYTFPKINVEPKPGDITRLRLELTNSYDGKLKGGFRISGLRLKCTNGQTIPEKFHEISAKHSAKFNLDEIVESITVALPEFQNVVKTWKNWHEVKMNNQEVIDLLTNRSSLAEKTVEQIAEQFKKEDQTKWGAFQAATYVISHETKSRKEENNRVRQIQIEQQITPLFYN